jgi:phi13 family phage major tail protein
MAKIDLKYPVYAIVAETDSAISYSGGKVLAKAITANINIETNDVELYADGAVAETDKSFSSGKVSLNIDDLPDFAKIDLLDYTEGAVVDAVIGTKELIASGAASPAFVGLGFYAKKVKNKVSYWRAIWLKKVQFAEPSDESKTKEKSVEFQTPTIEGTVMLAADGNWKEEATFSTEALAKAWLEGKCGLANKVATPASSVASGSYAEAQSVTLTCATSGASIYYTTDGTVPSATNGTLYSTQISCADPSNTCIKAVAVKTDYTTSDILELYITVA